MRKSKSRQDIQQSNQGPLPTGERLPVGPVDPRFVLSTAVPLHDNLVGKKALGDS